MKQALVFCHGWALDAKGLFPLQKALDPYVSVTEHLQLGYFEEYRIPRLDRDYAWIALGHSYGFSRLLQEIPCQGISLLAGIAVSGFTRFPRTSSEVRALRRAVLRSPEEGIKSFYQAHDLTPYQPVHPHALNLDRLLGDLDDLATSKSYPTFRELPVIVLHGRRDRLIREEELQSSFPEMPQLRFVSHPQATHALGLNEISWCVAQIAAFFA